MRLWIWYRRLKGSIVVVVAGFVSHIIYIYLKIVDISDSAGTHLTEKGSPSAEFWTSTRHAMFASLVHE